MMRLYTSIHSLSATDHIVRWRVGPSRKGLIRITNTPETDGRVFAELLAIKHLVIDDQVFHVEVKSGKGIELAISSPVIKKLVRGKSSKKHLLPDSHFLTTVLHGVSFSSSSASDDMLPDIEASPDKQIDYSSDNQECHIDTPALGLVKITTHAIEQYASRHEHGEALNPSKSLINRLSHPDLARQTLPKHVIGAKLKKYGSLENTEFWGMNLSSDIYYVIQRDPITDIGTLLTVYVR